MNTNSRRNKVNVVLKDHGLDALVFFDQRNLRYHCGFTGSDGFLVISRGESLFMSDSRYTLQANEQVEADRIDEYRIKTDGLIEALRELGCSQIGFEANLAYGMVCELQNKGESDWCWRPLEKELSRLRLHKDAAEIDILQRAAQLNAAAFSEIVESIVPGVVEREISLQLEYALKKGGAEEKSFDIIVASGPRGALPHGVASSKVLQRGELVTIDFGGRVDGYHADETVTLGIGEVPIPLRKVYDVVLEAHDRAIAAVRPGVPLRELDNIARAHIVASGYGENFGHGLGHGVGLDIHEEPRLSPRSDDLAEPGMVFTIEPGIYLPGVGGVRIEDMVQVTEGGCRVLTQLPKGYRCVAAG